MIYMYRCNRRDCSGENNGGAVLTECQVREIHKIHKDHPVLKQWQIAEIFKITQTQISDIINGKRWRKIYEDIHGEHFDETDDMEQLKLSHEEEMKQNHERASRDLDDPTCIMKMSEECLLADLYFATEIDNLERVNDIMSGNIDRLTEKDMCLMKISGLVEG